MKKLELAVPELEQIEINGEVFDVLMSDADIVNKSANYHKKYKNIDAKNIEQIQSAVNEARSLIDDILGKDAFKKISKGRPVSMSTALNWLMDISQAVYNQADEKIADKYE